MYVSCAFLRGVASFLFVLSLFVSVFFVTIQNLSTVKLLVCCSFSLLSVCATARTVRLCDTIIPLREVQVLDSRPYKFLLINKQQSLDTLVLTRYTNGSLTALLENETPIFVKSYGLGGLATTSFRGGSANHTAVFWNGFNISSPMNGQVDMSLLPVAFMSDININYGGKAATRGSGSVSGSIDIDNFVRLRDTAVRVTAGVSAGSFAAYAQNLQIEIKQKRYSAALRLINSSTTNDFEYNNIQILGKPIQKQQNAQFKQHGALAEVYYTIKKYQTINFRAWYQANDRNIPPTMLQNESKSKQIDENLRFCSQYDYNFNKGSLSISAAYFNEKLVFSDDLYAYKTDSRAQTFIAKASWNQAINAYNNLDFRAENTFIRAKSENYADSYGNEATQNRLAANAGYHYTSKNNKLNFLATLRDELVNKNIAPFTGSVNADYRFSPYFIAKASVNKVFRLPTLNDLYWTPGGNPNLLPENGYGQEISLLCQVKTKKEAVFLTFEPTLFNKNMDNWIIWLPSQSFWSPQNIMKVWSRGMETRTDFTFTIRKMTVKLGVNTSYVLATNERAKTDNDESVHKQLIYTPMYSGNGSFSVQYRDFFLRYNQTYTGYRYTATDNSEFLKPYTLSNIYLAYKPKINKYNGEIYLQSNNIFNTPYQVLLNRAMPLRSVEVGFKVSFLTRM